MVTKTRSDVTDYAKVIPMTYQDRTPTGPVPILHESDAPRLGVDAVLAAGVGFALASILTFVVAPRILTLIPLALAAFGVTLNAVGSMRARSVVGVIVGVIGSLVAVGVIVACLIAQANQPDVVFGL